MADTRARIVAAALDALRAEGIAGFSARTIARQGGFNQALIFYHFGSVEGLLIAVARSESERRAALYAAELREVGSLADLVAMARRLHEEEFRSGSVAALTQVLAGATRSDELARGVWDALEPWTARVGETIERLLAATRYAGVLSTDDLTTTVAALFLGVELLTGLAPERAGTTLFTTIGALAALIDTLTGTGPADPATTTDPATNPADSTDPGPGHA